MKKIIAFILTLIMVLSLAACGNDTVRDDIIETSGLTENQTTPSDSKNNVSESTEDESSFDTAWASNDFEALLPELPFTGWSTNQVDANTYKMELFGLNTSAATNPSDSAEPDGADKTKLINYLDSLTTYGFTVEETGETYKWLATDAAGNQIEFMCADGGCWITIEKNL